MDRGTFKMRWAYQTMACGLVEGFRMPGVEYAFQDETCCEYLKIISDASERLSERLGVKDEDDDVAIIIYGFEKLQEELCYRMYRYGAELGL